MDSVAKAYATQLANIEKKTGLSLEQLTNKVKTSGLTKHGEIREMLMKEFGLGHGDANSLVHHALQTSSYGATIDKSSEGDAVLDDIYTGAKAGLRPIHEGLMQVINELGEFEIAPKKGYVSLRRKKQFAMIGPGTKNRLELGLNMKGVAGTERLLEQPPGGMCQYKVFLTSAEEVNAEVVGWLTEAFQSAG